MDARTNTPVLLAEATGMTGRTVAFFAGAALIAGAIAAPGPSRGELATTGPYARIRHPQYAGFVLIMLGFLLQWPTLITLVMFPILVVVYVRLARREEQEAIERFGDAYRRYMASTPAFFPRLGRNVREIRSGT